MTIVLDELLRHVRNSKKIVSAWERHGLPGGRDEDNLRMIAEEVALLDSMAIAHPRRAKGLRRLADRYRSIRSRMIA
jgi:hypothetical protein